MFGAFVKEREDVIFHPMTSKHTFRSSFLPSSSLLLHLLSLPFSSSLSSYSSFQCICHCLLHCFVFLSTKTINTDFARLLLGKSKNKKGRNSKKWKEYELVVHKHKDMDHKKALDWIAQAACNILEIFMVFKTRKVQLGSFKTETKVGHWIWLQRLVPRCQFTQNTQRQFTLIANIQLTHKHNS